MFKEYNFFKGYFRSSKKYNKNFKKTKFFFNSLLLDLEKKLIPLLGSYEKNYELNFSKKMVKHFSKYENIIIIGMGGSILGTKSIYSFFLQLVVVLGGQNWPVIERAVDPFNRDKKDLSSNSALDYYM